MKNNVIAILNKIKTQLNIMNDVVLTPSKTHGDYSTNFALQAAKQLKKNPREIAETIVKLIPEGEFEKVEIAGPGFINFFLKSSDHGLVVKQILEENESYGRKQEGDFINIEYISANPTGHLHIGHARGAVMGSVLSRVFEFTGNKVDQEYYINDAGNQINVLGQSTFVRYKNECGIEMELPENSYGGQDIVSVAKKIREEVGDKYKDSEFVDDVKQFFKDKSKSILMDVIKEHIALIGIKMDIFFSEESLYKENKILPALEKLSNTYDKDGAKWLKTTLNGDDMDRVLIKSDKTLTYFAPDIVYHTIKAGRGYDRLINIWGSDHIGYIKRMETALKFWGLKEGILEVVTLQLVRLMRDGKELKMSKRMGTSFTLKELYDLIGRDAMRFYLILKSGNTQVTFDVDEATKKSKNNPIFTIKYTHARANQLLNKTDTQPVVGSYDSPREVALINKLKEWPELISYISRSNKVHLLTTYLTDLAGLFNSLYSNSKIVGDPREAELMALVSATKQVMKIVMDIIEIEAPERM